MSDITATQSVEELEAAYAAIADKVTALASPKKLRIDELASINRGQKPSTKAGEEYLAARVEKLEISKALAKAKGLV